MSVFSLINIFVGNLKNLDSCLTKSTRIDYSKSNLYIEKYLCFAFQSSKRNFFDELIYKKLLSIDQWIFPVYEEKE